MDCSDIERERNSSSAESRELISDSPHSTDKEAASNDEEDGAVERSTTTMAGKLQISPEQTLHSSLSLSSEDSEDFVPLQHKVKEYFKNPFRKWKSQMEKRKRQKRIQKIAAIEKRSPVVSKKKRSQYKRAKSKLGVPLEERKRRLVDRGIRFPCIPYKYLPFRLYFPYEQIVLGGFLNHIKNLKCERPLRESLHDETMGDSLENDESIQIRKYSYLDEDGPLSPISEPGENVNEDEEEIKVVDNSTFILDCEVPSKEDWNIVKKGKKRSVDMDTPKKKV